MKTIDDSELDESPADELGQIIEDMELDEELARRHSSAKPQIPEKYRDVTKYTAVSAEEYLAICDRQSFDRSRTILVIEPIDAFTSIDYLVPAHIAGIDEHSGTSLELFRHRQECLTGIHALGKITAHDCKFGTCQLSAQGDKDNIGIYLSDCRSNRILLQSPAECKISSGQFGFLEVDSQSRIEILSCIATELDLRAPECHIVLRPATPTSRSKLKLQAKHATLHGQFSSITGRAETLILPLCSLGVWQGTCDRRNVIMTPDEFTKHLDHAHPHVSPSDTIRVEAKWESELAALLRKAPGTTRQILVLEDRHIIDTRVELLTDVDISRRSEPWNHPVNGSLTVSRNRKQEINAPCKTIRLTGSTGDLTPAEYRQWQPLPDAPGQNLNLELF